MDLKKRTNERKEAIFYLYQLDLLKHNVDDELEGYAKDLVSEVLNNLKKVDQIITNCLVDYSLNRLSYLDRAIIRVATLEMLKNDVPTNIIINEAIEITKIFSNLDENKEKAFNNKLLDTIKNFLIKKD